MSSRLISQLLGYAGLLPFFGFCLGFSALEDWPRSLSIQGFVIYSLAIFTFLAGALWGQVLSVEADGAVSTLIVSNGLVLFGVAAILTAQAMMAAVFLMLGYIALLWYETRVSSLDHWYCVLRRRLTLGVVLAHIIFVVLHITGA